MKVTFRMEVPLGMEPPAPVVVAGMVVGQITAVDREAGTVGATLDDDVVTRMISAGVTPASIQMVLNAVE